MSHIHTRNIHALSFAVTLGYSIDRTSTSFFQITILSLITYIPNWVSFKVRYYRLITELYQNALRFKVRASNFDY